MTLSKLQLFIAALIICSGSAWAQSAEKSPRIGYLYPAGGQQGTTFQILAGGQSLQGVNEVYVSGEGVKATVLKHYRPLKNLDENERKELRRRIMNAWEKRWTEYSGDGSAPPIAELGFTGKFGKGGKGAAKENNGGKAKAKAVEAPAGGDVALPENPLIDRIDSMSIRELVGLMREISEYRKRQRNAQIAEMTLIEITIDPNAALGDRELRLKSQMGLTNPLCFQVGHYPEAKEVEPNAEKIAIPLPEEPTIELPVTLNGQIMPGDIDRFKVRAHKGQKLVVNACARHLVPYLADAVPGWFQAVVTIYDAEGKEVAFEDDYGFDPDPVILFTPPADGEYTIEIKDSIFRGREDFVYRIEIGESPFITSIFPLGGRLGEKTTVAIRGWNLPKYKLQIDTESVGPHIRQTAMTENGALSNLVSYAVDSFPECMEKEPNNSIEKSQHVEFPIVVNGKIDQPGDEDVFSFDGKEGENVVVEVFGRRLHSQIDSMARLFDSSGKEIASNDDHEDKEMGLQTHHADSYLFAALPSNGTYYVHLSDTQHQGGETCGYRLRISEPIPDFAIRVTPSNVNIPAGRSAQITVHVLRKEGFAGDIDLSLKNVASNADGQPIVRLDGGRIPEGRDSVRMTLTASGNFPNEPTPLEIEGRAYIGGQTVAYTLTPAEDMMQAFAYHHLVPTREFMVMMRGGKWASAPISIIKPGLVRIPLGGAAKVKVNVPKKMNIRKPQFELSEPPKGLSLLNPEINNGILTFSVAADADSLKAGYADNLIVMVSTEVESPKKGPKAKAPANGAAPEKRRATIGVLPAIPIEIIKK